MKPDHSFQGVFPRQLKKADGAVAGLAVPVLPFFEDGNDYGLFPAGWKCTCVQGMIVYVQQFLFSHTSEMADHVIGNVILLWDFLDFSAV